MSTKLALLGAESTGKTQLAQALAAHARGLGHSVTVVPEYLREWCDHQGRTPRADEQLALATEHARRIDQAAVSDWLIADTTPLMVAVYSDLLFNDTSLYPMALAQLQGFDHILVTGQDVPWVADGLQRDGPQVRGPVDQTLRAALDGQGLRYQVVYGLGPQRLTAALRGMAVGSGVQRDMAGDGSDAPWQCANCSDPDCEHRLFTQLVRRRSLNR
ncbi:MAG: ATP-binding protein [Pseudomonadota bacterium]